MTLAGPVVASDEWERLPPFRDAIRADEQPLVIAGTGGAKSTLIATLTLPTRSLVAIDTKGSLTLPRARVVELPPFEPDRPDGFDLAVRRTLAWQDDRDGGSGTNRVVVRFADDDVDELAPHDRLFGAIYRRGSTLLWVDEITGTGVGPQRIGKGLRALSARGRTRGVGAMIATQAPYGLLPGLLRRNASVTIIGPIDPDDAAAIHRPGVEIAASLPTRTGRFIVYRSGERQPYRLYLPIPPALRGWTAP